MIDTLELHSCLTVTVSNKRVVGMLEFGDLWLRIRVGSLGV